MKKPYIVAITGGTCSGKSFLTDMLDERFTPVCRTKVIHMDQYFKKNPPMTIAPITRKEYVEHNSPDTLELSRLYDDFNSAAGGNEYDLIIIEGLFALYLDKIRELSDLKVFVDLNSDERLVRRIKRFQARGDTYEEITERYLATVRFRHNELIEPSRWHADIVLNGTIDSHKGADILTVYLKSRLGL